MESSKRKKIVVSAILLAKPGIIISVAFTGFAGMVVAYKSIPPAFLTIIGILTLLLSASGSAILNNILDKKIDQKMERLNKRVEALETLGDKNAFIISVLMIILSLFLSYIYLNWFNTLLILLAIFSYTILYTIFLKRSSPFGTILGGIPGALPVVIGYTAIKPSIGIDAIILFIFMLLWQPPHFWSLAQKYKDDYKKAGIPVLPVTFGTKYTNMLILIYSLSLLPITLMLWLMGFTTFYFAIAAIILGIYFDYAVIKSTLDNKSYGKAFSASIIYMLFIMISLVIDIVLKPSIPVDNVFL